jgi:hypothetical protein
MECPVKTPAMETFPLCSKARNKVISCFTDFYFSFRQLAVLDFQQTTCYFLF